jgi:cytoskeletal protein RodZ
MGQQETGLLESLGARLKREREQRKITLDEISLSTKIGTRFLIAIEEGHFEELPGGIFNKNFVRAYARSVGSDEALAVAEYELATAPKLPETQPVPGSGVHSPAPKPKPSSHSSPAPVLVFPDENPDTGASRVPWEWFAVALLAVAFGLALWGFVSREKSSRPIVIPPASSAVPAAPAVAEPLNQPTSSTPPPVAAAGAGGGNSVPSPSLSAPSVSSPSVSASSVPSSSEPSPSDSKPAVAETSASSTASTSPEPGSAAFLVQIKARQDSWVTISADGRQIMQDTLYASAEKSIGAHNQVVIRTGNAGALEISFNGNKLPALGGYNQVKTLTFDPKGLKF